MPHRVVSRRHDQTKALTIMQHALDRENDALRRLACPAPVSLYAPEGAVVRDDLEDVDRQPIGVSAERIFSRAPRLGTPELMYLGETQLSDSEGPKVRTDSRQRQGQVAVHGKRRLPKTGYELDAPEGHVGNDDVCGDAVYFFVMLNERHPTLVEPDKALLSLTPHFLAGRPFPTGRRVGARLRGLPASPCGECQDGGAPRQR